jgi:hypothetical protein
MGDQRSGISAVCGLFGIGREYLGHPPELKFLPLIQQAVQPNETTFNLGQANPFELGGSDIAKLVFLAIQHAYCSIKCIAESTLTGLDRA